MKLLKTRRQKKGVSQRRLAERAGVAFRTVQLMESGNHDWRLSSLRKISHALGLPESSIERAIGRCLSRETDSVGDITERICLSDKKSWPIHLFNFVDAFRRLPRIELVAGPPDLQTPAHIQCLVASTVESLCHEVGMDPPAWCAGIAPLRQPWFVSGTESLKALALVHSPARFRGRNVFVLDNFLDRA